MISSSLMIFWDDKGNTISCTSEQAGVFTLLDKLGLKSIPTKNCTMWTTSNGFPVGSYIISYNTSSGGQMTVNVNVPATVSHISTTFSIPEIEEPKFNDRKTTKEMRRAWRSTAMAKSRNTGR